MRYRAPRFDNRIASKPNGRIAPSLQHKADAQIHLIENIFVVAPITQVTIEVGLFDPALLSAMQTTGIPPKGDEYQHVPLYYADSLHSAVFQRGKYTGKICKKSALKNKTVILHLYHALYWKNRHADTLHECITVCPNCHTAKNHKPCCKL